MNSYLEASEILPFLHGCCGLYELNGRTGFSRFTPEQLDFYSARSEMDFFRCHCPAGIYLECVTDAEEISFDYSLFGTYCFDSGIDIWENGVFRENIPLSSPGEQDVHVCYTCKEEGNSVIRIYFPNGSVFIPYHFMLGNARPTQSKKNTIVFYGDSITQSAYITPPSLSWHCFVADHMEAEYLNRGIGSFIFDEKSLPQETDCDPDFIFVEYGANDIVQVPDLNERLIRADAYCRKLRELHPDAKIFGITPDFLGPKGADKEVYDRLEDYCPALGEIFKKYGMQAIAGKELSVQLDKMLCPDYVHFNEAGSAVFANRLLCAIRV